MKYKKIVLIILVAFFTFSGIFGVDYQEQAAEIQKTGSSTSSDGDLRQGAQEAFGNGDYSEGNIILGYLEGKYSRGGGSVLDGLYGFLNDYQSKADEVQKFIADLREKYPEASNSNLQNNKNEQEQTKEELKEDAESKNDENSAETAGDPVFMPTGEYVQNEIDIYFGKNFVLRRNYMSGNSDSGVFAKGWSSSIDEHLIFGIEPFYREREKEFLKLIVELEDIISAIEDDLTNNLKVPLDYSAEEIINSRYDKIYKLYEKNEDVEEAIEALGKVNANPESIEKFEKSYELVNEQYSVYSSLKETIREKIDDLYKYHAELEKIKSEYDAYKTIIRECEILEKLNSKSVLLYGNNYRFLGLGIITFLDENATPHVFTKKSEGQYLPISDNERILEKIVLQSNGQYVIYKKDGTKKIFTENGLLYKEENRNGNYIEFVRDDKKDIKEIITSDSEKYDVKNENGYVIEIKNSRDETEKILFTYKDNFLVSVTDAENVITRFSYTSDEKLSCIIKADGSTVKFIYGERNSSGKSFTTETINEEGNSEFFEYFTAEKKTIYTDHSGKKTVIRYDDHYRTVEKNTPDGSVQTFYYDKNGDCIKTILNGMVTEYRYDKFRNKIESIYEDGSCERFAYDDFGLITSFVDRDGMITEYERDGKGNLLKLAKGGTTVSEMKYDSFGRLIETCEYANEKIVTRLEYDDFGNPVKVLIGRNVFTYKYDNRNRVVRMRVNGKEIKSISYSGNVTVENYYTGLITETEINKRKDIVRSSRKDSLTGEVREYLYDYDRRHLPLRIWISDGKNKTLFLGRTYFPEGELFSEAVFGEVETWLNFYDYKNNHLSVITKRKANRNLQKEFFSLSRAELELISEEVSVEYQKSEILFGNTIKFSATDSLLNTTEYIFNSSGYLYSITNPLGEEKVLSTSPSGRLLQAQTDFGGTYVYSYDSRGNLYSSGKQGAKETLYEYYPSGKRKREISSIGEVSEYFYNEDGNLERIESDGYNSYYSYDELGRLVLCVNGGNGIVENSDTFMRITYSTDGRIAKYSYGDEVFEDITMNAFGETIKVVGGEGNCKSYVYDVFGNVIKVSDSYNNATSYKYNPFGLETEIIFPDSSFVKYEYDGNLNLVKITDGEGVFWKGKYDSGCRLVSEKSRPGIEKNYTYDAIGRVTGVYSNGEKLEEYTYGIRGKEMTFTDAKGNEYKYFYDSFGKLEREQNRMTLSQRYTYNDADDLIEKIDFAGNKISFSKTRTLNKIFYPNGKITKFKTDSFGNILSAENEDGTLVYKYKKSGLLESVTDTTIGESILYSYDKSGRRERMIGCGRDIRYSYGKNDELLSVKDLKNHLSVSFEYDLLGREKSKTFGNGNTKKIFYDQAGRTILIAEYNSRGILLTGEGYVYDDQGRLAGSVNHKGEIIFYKYDSFGRVSEVYYPESTELLELQKLEAEENEIFFKDNFEKPEIRWLTGKESNDFSALLFRMQHGLENVLSTFHVLRFEKFSYDKNGNRISKTTSFGTIYYVVDEENRLIYSGAKDNPHIVYKYDSNGNLLHKISTMKEELFTYNYNNRLCGYKSVDKLTGKVSEKQFCYDAFGRRISESNMFGAVKRTVYDSFSLEEVKTAPVFSNGKFLDSYSSGFNTVQSEGTRDRYVFISDNYDSERYEFTESSVYEKVRTASFDYALYASGDCVGINRDDSVFYFMDDMRGSLRSESNSQGEITREFSYDSFGKPISASFSGRGFIGKEYDEVLKLYNFGLRDYSPSTGRFTTSDPVRDGTNWFEYCSGDPVNFIDLWGLELILTVNKETQTMDIELNVNGTQYKGSIFVTTGVVPQDPSKPSNSEKQNGNGSSWTQFPNGTWNLTGIGNASQPSDNSQVYFGESWITTDAHQELSDGKGGTVDDGGYFIHLTTCSNTAGCVGLQYKDNGEMHMNLLLRLFAYN